MNRISKHQALLGLMALTWGITLGLWLIPSGKLIKLSPIERSYLHITLCTVGLLFTAILYLHHQHWRKVIKKLTSQLESLAQGNTQAPNIKTKSQILATCVDNVHQLTIHTQELFQLIDKISQENFDFTPETLQSQNQLIQAMLTLSHQLQQTAIENQENSWANMGFSIFASILTQKEDPVVFYSRVLNNLVEYVGACQGGLLQTNEFNEQISLELIACYAYGEKQKNQRKKILPNEGLTGRALAEKTSRLISNLPDDYWHITSSLGSTIPQTLLIVPLKIQQDVIGMLELGRGASI